MFDQSTKTISRFTDETESELLGSFIVNSSTAVTTLPPQPGRKYVFMISDPPSKISLILAAADFKEVESWMLCMIQIINGDYRDEENFEVDLSVRKSGSASICSDLCTTGYLSEKILHLVSKESGEDVHERGDQSPRTSSDLVRQCGYLYKHGKSPLLRSGTWKYRYFVFDSSKGALRWYKSEQDFILNPQNFINHRIVDRFTRVVLTGHILHSEFVGSMGNNEEVESPPLTWCCFSLISGVDPACKEKSFRETKLLRLCCASEETVVQWMVLLEQEISQLADNDLVAERQSPRTRRETQADFPTGRRKMQRRTFFKRGATAVRLLVRPRGDFLETDEVYQTFYWTYFVQPCSLPLAVLSIGQQDQGGGGEEENWKQYIQVVVYENQRLSSQVFGDGWHNRHLLVSDPPKLSNVEGVKFVSRYLKRTNPPVGYRWFNEKDPELVHGDSECIAEKSGAWVDGDKRYWLSEGMIRFSVVRDGTEDDGGWKYARSFNGGYGDGNDPTSSSESHWHSRVQSEDQVRRRKLFRIAKLHT